MHKVSRSLLLVGVLAFGTLAAACGDGDTILTGGTGQTGVSSITVTPASVTLQTGGTATFAASVTTLDAATSKDVTWSLGAGSVGTISTAGAYSAGTTAGTATVIATATGDTKKQAAAFVTVTAAPAGTVTGIAFTTSGRNVAVGSTLSVAAAITGTSTNTTVNYTSSDVSVATVSAAGLVTGLKNGVTTITATSAADASKSVTTVVTVGTGNTVNDPASVVIKSVTQNGLQFPVQLNNVQGQIDVTMTVERGSQQVTKLDLIVSRPGLPDTVVASQTISSTSADVSGISAAMIPVDITLSFNTANFNPTTGAVSFRNGPLTLKAQITVLGATTPTASNSVAVTFNNVDGFYIEQTALNSVAGRSQPNSASDLAGRVWFQGGAGLSVKSVPVIYSAGKGVQSRTLTFTSVGAGSACAAGCSAVATGGGVLTTVIALPAALADTGIVSVPNALGDDGNALTLVTNGGNGVINAQAFGVPGFPNNAVLANASIGTRLIPMRIDNAAPATPGFALTGTGTGTTSQTAQVFNWVNGAYQFAKGVTIGADAGVGLVNSSNAAAAAGTFAGGAAINTGLVSIAAGPATTAGAPSAVVFPSATSTVSEAGIAASDVNLTYSAQVTERDLLGNASSKFLDNAPAANAALQPTSVTVGVGAGAVVRTTFGVDLAAPSIRFADATGAGAGNAAAGILSRTADSVRKADDRFFVVDYLDDRAGFSGTAFVPAAVGAISPMARTVSRFANTVLRQGPGATTCALPVAGSCAALFGATTLAPYGTTLPDNWVRSPAVSIDGNSAGDLVGYYGYSAQVRDMAGNLSAVITRRSAVDPALPMITGFLVPSSITGGGDATFVPTADDDLEVITGKISLTYAVMNLTYPFGTFPNNGTRWDNVLTTPLQLSLTVNNFIDQIETVDGTDAPVNTAAASRPTVVTTDVQDVLPDSTTVGFSQFILGSAFTQAAQSWTTFNGSINQVTSWKVMGGTRNAITLELRGPTGQSIVPFSDIQIWSRIGAGPEYVKLAGSYSVSGVDNGTNRVWTVTFTPSATLSASTTFNVRALGVGSNVAGTALLGNALATNNFAFTTAAP